MENDILAKQSLAKTEKCKEAYDLLRPFRRRKKKPNDDWAAKIESSEFHDRKQVEKMIS